MGKKLEPFLAFSDKCFLKPLFENLKSQFENHIQKEKMTQGSTQKGNVEK